MNLYVDTQHSFNFVKEFIPQTDAKILQVGCGDGELAEELQKYGYRIKALDLNPENVAAACARGVDAEAIDILQFASDESYDAVLFSCSLHHIASLETVLNIVKKLLNEKGRILIEDFALEQMDHKTASWFYDTNDLVAVAIRGSLEMGKTAHDPLDRWKEEHGTFQSVHTRKEIIKVMERNFGNIHAIQVPYLYRHCKKLSLANSQGHFLLEKIFELEAKNIEKKVIEPIGFRIVAKKYFSYLK